MIFNMVVAGLAVALFAFGHWGRRHVAELVPSTFTLAAREQTKRQYRRGATTCQVVAVLMFAYGIGRFWVAVP